MIGLPELHEKISNMKRIAATITEKKNAVKARISAAEAEGRTEKWTKQRVAEIRAEGTAAIDAALGQLAEVHATFSKHENFWADKELALSCIPLTRRGPDNISPENPVGESMARTALLAEASRMSNHRLELMAADALASGDYARMYLFSLEGNSRQKPTKIDTSGVVLPEQQAALNMFTEARRSVAHAVIDLREAHGARPDELAIARLSAERGITA
ncbi:MAG: hypothetical protein BWK76_09695 [Desulfobulbaceae bacterium A2]|nr:MAG: hypothetical protein BWK76_09695 [Desulfobulbaceae bacterium A2]